MNKLFWIFIFSFKITFAQVSDNFSDGNFTSNPVWSGDNGEFIINASSQLQLNNSIAGASYLSAAISSSSLNNMEWRFFVKQSFSPSSSNFGRVYLASDQMNLEGNLNGYYLQFGEAGSNDAIELFRQSGSINTSVTRGTNGTIANSFDLGVKVTRDAVGNWKVYIDTLGGTNYILDAAGTDNTYITGNYFGIAAAYTISNSTKFYYDDFYNGPIVVDTVAPTIVSINVINNAQLDVLFNEAVDLTTSQVLTNYSANNSIGNPITALRDASNFALVHLTFSTPFPNGLNNTLTITNVQDLSGNVIVAAASNFSFYQPKQYDVVINEIMADPDPIFSSLPNYEYIELFNRTNHTISLNNWQLVVGTNSKKLSNISILPDSFVVLASTTAAPNYPASYNVIGVPSFPALTNTGQTITLKNELGKIISTVSYTDDWYKDETKKDGGWSLEQIFPNNPCGGMYNWKASTSNDAGTPGRKNSVLAINADNTQPELIRVSVIALDTIQLFFDESLDSTTMLNPSLYIIDNSIGSPINVKPVSPDFKSVVLALTANLQIGIYYTITVSNTITDCVGNPIGVKNSKKFAVPQTAAVNDIVINEILSNPKSGGVDFVEIYNRSNKVIDLKTISISEYDTITNVPINLKTISSDGYLLFPEEYLVISSNADVVKNQYTILNPEAFIDVASMISMNISDGTVCLSTATAIIDYLKYDEEMHFALLNDTKGVTLERIDFNRNTNDKTNWHSAAADAGYGTPGYKNSQYHDAGETDNAIEITPEIFSPDEDGVNDVVNINYNFDTPGFVANISIYDSKGRLIKLLKRNELLGTFGTFSWDGINESREKARLGIYIVYVEVFDLQGNVKKYKKTCVLGGKL